jgi:nucleotide-binding universal stress UspA family protein
MIVRTNLSSAIEDFHQARRQAALERITSLLTGKSIDLLSYDDVRDKLKARESASEQLKEISLDAIVGSVGRYSEFTRSFLPRENSDEGRWAKVAVAMTDFKGVPPIEVYQIGDAYFVLDGNHRVSVARQLGAEKIQAYVTPVHAKVPLSPDDDPDDLIIKAEYTDFLERTQLDRVRPQADLTVTAPGKYPILEKHIEVHRHFMGLEQQREIPYQEAVAHWYDEVYRPVVDLIRQQGLLRDFPDRTETDLYIWIAEHRGRLEEELGWEIPTGAAAADLRDRFSPRFRRVLGRVTRRFRNLITPSQLKTGPPAGQWRRQRAAERGKGRLFADILVAVNGEETGWHALDQALLVARREGAGLRGLHVVPEEAEEQGESIRAIEEAFYRRCQDAGVVGQLAVDTGEVWHRICQRARWTDLVTLSLSYPPPPQPMAKLGSGLTAAIRRCPRPILLVPSPATAMDRALLAYDGSPKAQEALFIATYLAGRWQTELTVVTVKEDEHVTVDTLNEARSYLESHHIEARFVHKEEPVASSILAASETYDSNLIIMGGYGGNPMVEIVLGSAVDEVLRTSRRPMLVCR